MPQQTSHVTRTQHLVRTPVVGEPTGSSTYKTNTDDDDDTAVDDDKTCILCDIQLTEIRRTVYRKFKCNI